MAARPWRGAVLAAALGVCLGAGPPGGGAPAAAEALAVPDRIETTRLVWTTLIAIDHANRTGNYSVLRDLAAPSFRDANDAAKLAGIFAKIRNSDIGLNRVVLLPPELTEPPELLENGLYRVTGHFPFRPVGISFDLLFQNVGGAWRLFGVSLAPLEAPTPGAAEGQPTPPKKP